MSGSIAVRLKSSGTRKEAICHYVLLYLMLAMGDSFLYDRVLTHLAIPMLLVLMLIVLANRKYQFVYPLSILSLGLITMLAVRASTGAMGPTELISWATMIGITFIAVRYNTSRFLIRLIKLTSVLTAFSLVVFFASQIVPGIWGRVTPISYLLTFGDTVWLDSINYIVTYYQAHGLLLYVDRGFDFARNVGIFREPAVYQIILNSMIFVLLFMKPAELNDRLRKRLVFLYVAAIVTTGSATGYGTSLVIFIAYFISKKSSGERISVSIPVLLGLFFVFILAISFLLNPDWIENSVLGRFINDGQLAFDASGEARVGAANAAISLISEHPFGCGYEVYGESISTGNAQFVAACLLKVAAVYGLIMAIGILAWVFYPVFRCEDLGIAAKLAFVIIYLIATYFECEVFYTTLIFIPLYLYSRDCVDGTRKPKVSFYRLRVEASGVCHEIA